MLVSPPDFWQSTVWQDPTRAITTNTTSTTSIDQEIERLRKIIQSNSKDTRAIQITLRPITNGYLLTLEHKGVKHERAVMDFSEIGSQVMVALAAINLEG